MDIPGNGSTGVEGSHGFPVPGKTELPAALSMTDPILLTTVEVRSFIGEQGLTSATAFFFEREDRLYLVTSRHVFVDEPSQHFPDRVEILLHVDSSNLCEVTGFSIPLFRDGLSLWRDGSDSAGEIDVAVMELDRGALPAEFIYRPFTPSDLPIPSEPIEIGSPVLIVGFPLGFHDTLHHVAVVRQAIIASSFGLRFKGKGYFLTDARTHRGTSGAPVVLRLSHESPDGQKSPWLLLGVHSARLDVGPREPMVDEALGLNCTWYADILMTLTARTEAAASPLLEVDAG